MDLLLFLLVYGQFCIYLLINYTKCKLRPNMDYRKFYNNLKSKLQDCGDNEIEFSLKQIETLIEKNQSIEKEIRRKHHNYMTILETVREISLKALDIPRFEQYIINMLRGHFGAKTVIFLRQEEYLDTFFGVHTPGLP